MSIYAGIPISTLSLWLSEAQTAYHDLVAGKQIVQLSRGDKRFSYTAATANDLRTHIKELQTAIAVASGSNDPRTRPAVATWTR